MSAKMRPVVQCAICGNAVEHREDMRATVCKKCQAVCVHEFVTSAYVRLTPRARTVKQCRLCGKLED